MPLTLEQQARKSEILTSLTTAFNQYDSATDTADIAIPDSKADGILSAIEGFDASKAGNLAYIVQAILATVAEGLAVDELSSSS